MRVQDLGLMPYRDAWAVQETLHERVLGGAEECILLVEHPPVITVGRREEGRNNILAPAEQLGRLGVEVVHSDRGGDVTFHGPGQLVAYPIVRLADRGLSVGGYVHALEAGVIAALARWNLTAQADPGAVGVWTLDGGRLAKICAVGVRIRRGVSLHGLALNVETDLSYFNLIVPCGLAERPVTSLRATLGDGMPGLASIKDDLITSLEAALAPR